MNPIIKVSLPPLLDETENKLLSVANTYEQFKYSNGTLGKQYQEQPEKNEEIEKVKNLYGFDYLPQHRSQSLDISLQNEIRNRLKLSIPGSMYVQVIESENSFIHTDGGHRKCSLYYLLTDNNSAITNFYTTEKKPIISTVWDPANVRKHFSFEMLQHNWYVFSHDEIHSVNNIKGLRVALIIDMTKQFNTYEKLVSYLKTTGAINA
jgi:hypothetical protein